MKWRIRQFTRYEILALAAIVVVVFVLLRAAVGGIQRGKGRGVCVDHVRQISSALQMYARDWGGCAPPYTTTTCSQIFLGRGEAPRVIELGRFASTPALKKCFAPYLRRDAWYCPLDPRRRKGARPSMPPLDHTQTSYYVDIRVALWRPLNIYRLPVLPRAEWEKHLNEYMYAIYWVDTDDVTRGGPYYLRCSTWSHGGGISWIYLKFDGSIVCPRN